MQHMNAIYDLYNRYKARMTLSGHTIILSLSSTHAQRTSLVNKMHDIVNLCERQPFHSVQPARFNFELNKRSRPMLYNKYMKIVRNQPLDCSIEEQKILNCLA